MCEDRAPIDGSADRPGDGPRWRLPVDRLRPFCQNFGEATPAGGCSHGFTYVDLFRQVWGADACDSANVDEAYDAIGYSIAAYEASPEVNAFSSKFDYAMKGQAKLTKEEQVGRALFNGQGKCARCHISRGQKPLFTDFTFDNLGLPKNPENPFYDAHPDFVDLGLGGFLTSRPDYASYAAENMGKHKVPTLRNVEKACPASRRPSDTTGISRASRASCTSTTRAT